MSDRFWQGEWPNLSSISISISSVDPLSPLEMGVLYRLAWTAAASAVHSQFSAPAAFPSIPADDKALRAIAMCSAREWLECKDAVLSYFTLVDGRYRLIDESIVRLTKNAGRSSLPVAVRAAVMNRDGERCVYCGCDQGPFHFDHLYPVALGGPDDPSNLVIACAPCNLSKGAKTLAEWRLAQ